MSETSPVALATPNALAHPVPSHPIPKAQHNIPRFLLKLYEIVNDPANEALTKWSEAGDSFYIFNQEKFAREILGKWFKHQNFSSFVRQLNLYGFRKIASLQQGLLRMDNEPETIQFAHSHFHHGQPDLLALIQRKRNPPSHAQLEDHAVGLLQQSLSQQQDTKDQSQAVDVRSIVEGINSIRRQQQTITADLAALKQSNDALWKEAIEARERHVKHEETINRILKFLAGLFGRVIQTHTNHLHNSGRSTAAPGRLMIGDGREGHDESGHYFGDGLEVFSDVGSREHTPISFASERFAAVDTPGASIASPAPTVTEVHEPLPSILPQPAQEVKAQQPAAMPQLLTSPTHLQTAMQALANAQNTRASKSPSPDSLGLFVPANAIQPPPLSYPAPTLPVQNQQLILPAPSGSVSSLSAAPTLAPSDQAGAALLDNAAQLKKTYNHAAEIDADIDSLQSNINSLICNMGLDPNNITFPTVETPPGSVPMSTSSTVDSGASDFSFDQWLNEITNAGVPDLVYPPTPMTDQPAEDLSTLLDVPAYNGLSPSTGAAVAPAPGTTQFASPSGVKRKVDLVEIPEGSPDDARSAKKKR
ncbi:hypothetical protein C8Q80DRAFT_1270881 [Daedaleopsis nitida]|nr:hypothetical protein C8Q80DRAFT_1270881 [Daedaleopsis nitida]